MRKDTVAENLTKSDIEGERSNFLEIFIFSSIVADSFFCVLVFLLANF